MNVSSPGDGAVSSCRPSVLRRFAPVVLAILAALPTAAPARTYWSVNIGSAYPVYPVYRPLYRPYPVYRAYPVYPAYPVYESYPAYPAYSEYDESSVYSYHHRHRHHYVASSSRSSTSESSTSSAVSGSSSYTASGSGHASHAAPPPLPEDVQPPIPGDGYIWTPGYWSYASDDYFWVPGEWVLAPYPGALWTPAYWGWNSGYYAFHPGYWGLHVGYYGGINYGFGYFGIGYVGGYWNDGAFFYNRAVNHIGFVNVRNAYNFTFVNIWANRGTRVSFNGGPGGIKARPTATELAVAHQRRQPPVAAQQREVQKASQDREMFASFNHGAPPLTASRSPRMSDGANEATTHGLGPRERAAQWRDEQNRAVSQREPARTAMGHRGDVHADADAGMPRFADRASRHDGPPSSMALHRGMPDASGYGQPQRRDYAGHFAGPPDETPRAYGPPIGHEAHAARNPGQ